MQKNHTLIAGCFWVFLITPGFLQAAVIKEEESASYWIKQAQDALRARLSRKLNVNVAKNVIVFVGDGMGIPTITAARVYKGQKHNKPGEESQLIFDTFPHVGLIKTYSVNKQIPDSAATATAIFCGVKTNSKTLGLTAKAKYKNCSSSFGNEVTSIMQWAQAEGKHTGLVTTTRVTDATPAATYSHVANRKWESSHNKPPDADKCMDIAMQLVRNSPGKDMKVIFGGGLRSFRPPPLGKRNDDKNLIKEWLMAHPKSAFVNNTKDLKNVNVLETDYLLGLFNKEHMQYELLRKKGPEGKPSLVRMTKVAIQMLQKGPSGFFLLVEGGKIDLAHHSNTAKLALDETLQFDRAVQMALKLTDPSDTLIIVTADHSHVMTINGYPDRGDPILGIGGVSSVDKLPFTTLMYTTGPGFKDNPAEARRGFTTSKLDAYDYQQLALIPMGTEHHGGEDVAIYATGPMAHLFHGVQEQNYIAHAIGYAACVGNIKDHCGGQYDDEHDEGNVPSNSISPNIFNPLLLYLSIIGFNGIHVFVL